MGDSVAGDVRRAFVHGHVYMLAPSARHSVIEGNRDAQSAVGRCHAIGKLSRGSNRRFALLTGDIQQIAEGDGGDVIGFVFAPWTRPAKRGDRGDDKPGINGAQLRVVQAEPVRLRG
jgi:hypothetical protein